MTTQGAYEGTGWSRRGCSWWSEGRIGGGLPRVWGHDGCPFGDFEALPVTRRRRYVGWTDFWLPVIRPPCPLRTRAPPASCPVSRCLGSSLRMRTPSLELLPQPIVTPVDLGEQLLQDGPPTLPPGPGYVTYQATFHTLLQHGPPIGRSRNQFQGSGIRRGNAESPGR